MDVQGIKDLLGISYEENLFDEKGLVSTEFLKRITMRRDEIVYNLREIHVENGLNFEDIKKSVELHPEEMTYNAELYDSDNITMVQAKGKNGQQMTFYYIESEESKTFNSIVRQMRTQTKDGKISYMAW